MTKFVNGDSYKEMLSREIKLQKIQKLRSKSPKIKDMLHENMISSMISNGNIALTGASFQSFSKRRCSFLAANLGAYEKSLRNTCLGTYILRNSDD